MSDCQSCGACCQALPSYKGKAYVVIYDDDVARMSWEQLQQYTMNVTPDPPQGSGLRGIKLEGQQCSALAGEIGSCVSCNIYENRPDVCRKFDKDSDICTLARQEAGLGEFSNNGV